MFRKTPPFSVGHNPLAGLTYVAVFGLYLLIIFTGFALYSVSAYTSYMGMWDFLLPIFGGPQTARWLHHVTMWLLIGFAVHHLFSALLVSRVEKNGTIDSIFSDKSLPETSRIIGLKYRIRYNIHAPKSDELQKKCCHCITT